jgi:hypothetical protein
MPQVGALTNVRSAAAESDRLVIDWLATPPDLWSAFDDAIRTSTEPVQAATLQKITGQSLDDAGFDLWLASNVLLVGREGDGYGPRDLYCPACYRRAENELRSEIARDTDEPPGDDAEEDGLSSLVAGSPPTILRVYRGNQQADAIAAFEQEASELSRLGYLPSTQNWAPGQWGRGAFLVALLLCIVIIGILVFLYMLIVKPEGTLTVTYARMTSPPASRPSALSPSQTRAGRRPPRGQRAEGRPVAPVSRTLTDRLRQLQQAHDAGLISDEEFTAKRKTLLEGL